MDTSTGRRTAATWVAATGAFLLVAAAGVFVSVKWDDIPDAAKLGILFAFTGAALFGGQAVRRSLPATGEVLFHLGAFLLPIDLAAVSVRADMTWGELLLAQGALVGLGLGALALWDDSVVLRWAATAGVVALAAGVGAVSDVPAAVALVAFALLAARWLDAPSAAWAAVAGLAPALAGIARVVVDSTDRAVGSGTLADLGFGPHSLSVTSWGVGFVAAGVLARSARRRGDVAVAFTAVAVALVGFATSLGAGETTETMNIVAVAAVFFVAELVALGLRRDDFWSGPMHVVATGFEIIAVPVTLCSVLLGWFGMAFAGETFPALGTALAVAATAWLAADLRRQPITSLTLVMSLARGGGSGVASLGFAVSAASAVGMFTARFDLTVFAAAVAATLLVVLGRPLGAVVAAMTVGFSLLATPTTGWSILATVVPCAWAATLRARRREGDFEYLLAAVASLGAVCAGIAWGPLATVVVVWVLALVLEQSSPRLGDFARLGLVVPFFLTGDPLVFGAVVTVLATDAMVFRRAELGAAAAVAFQLFALSWLDAIDVARPESGLALCVTAIVWAGLAAVLDGGWRPPFVVGSFAAIIVGLPIAAADPQTFADAVIVTGGLLTAAGIAARHTPSAHLGGVVTTMGVIGHLAVAGVDAAEPYVVPVAVHLLLAGWLRRQTVATSSWLAYVPAVALVGGTALAERLAGGAEWHVLVAVGIGTAAVALGGWQRLAGPLLTGTALLVVATAHESLGALAGIPTWTWLAVAGTTLLGTGVLLERTDTSPVVAGRRLVDVIGERFE